MSTEKLRIFVSGREDELDDERAIAIEVIKSFHFAPSASEGRPASEIPIEDNYLGEVSDADIYVGIFGKQYSEPTKKEFDTARANDIPVLVFEKQLKDGKRDSELDKFLQEIKDHRSGITTKKYTNVIDLRESLNEALSSLLSRKFKTTKELDRIKSITSKEEVTTPIPGVTFEPGNVTFVKVEIPEKSERGKTLAVSAQIEGSTKNGFLDVAIEDQDGNRHWFPDPKSWNSALDLGQLKLTTETYANTWEFSIPTNSKPGKYKAIMGAYEDSTDLEAKKRKLIAYKEKELEIT